MPNHSWWRRHEKITMNTMQHCGLALAARLHNSFFWDFPIHVVCYSSFSSVSLSSTGHHLSIWLTFSAERWVPKAQSTFPIILTRGCHRQNHHHCHHPHPSQSHQHQCQHHNHPSHQSTTIIREELVPSFRPEIKRFLQKNGSYVSFGKFQVTCIGMTFYLQMSFLFLSFFYTWAIPSLPECSICSGPKVENVPEAKVDRS